MANETAVQVAQPTKMERFTEKIIEHARNAIGEIQLTEHQKNLIGSYYIYCERALQVAEENRARKNQYEKDASKKNDLPVDWKNVNMFDLALDLVYYSKLGLDMAQDNHLFPIPYKNNKTQKYDMTLMRGYNGIAYIAAMYALDPPEEVITELVYSTDEFVPLKKSYGQDVEGYKFVVRNPFERGEIIGGFGYYRFADQKKNRLVFMSRKEMDKRRPAYASAEFWGGEKYNSYTKQKEQLEGWQDEMYLKTLKRFVYSPKNIPLDPKLIEDAAYKHMKRREADYEKLLADEEIAENANTVDITAAMVDEDGVLIEQGTSRIVANNGGTTTGNTYVPGSITQVTYTDDDAPDELFGHLPTEFEEPKF